jgi:hypothetical protein
MASGSLISAFLDFNSGTGVGRLTTPSHPMQLVTAHTWLWPRLWKNNGMPCDGGQNLTFWFLPKTAGTYEEVLPGSTTVPKNLQVLQKGVIDWRMSRAHSVYVDAEFLLNDRINGGSRESIFEQFVKIRDEKAIIRKTDVAVGRENQLGAVPNKARMEGQLTTDATSPYSIFAHINEYGTVAANTAGLWGNGATASAAVTASGGAWTVKENIDPTAAAVNANMTLQHAKYGLGTSDSATNLVGGMDNLWMQIDWEQPDSLSQYQSDEKLNNIMFLTSKQGRQGFMTLMRSDNDRYAAGPQDPAYGDPQFHGIPLKRWDLMETAAIYDGASALQTEGTAAGTQFIGPRVIALNGNHLFPVCHRDRMEYVDPPLRALGVPDTWVQYESTWWNLACKSYKHQGILFPFQNVYNATNNGGNLYA